MRQSSRGFSLVELSIVLVILGLLTGGILGGQALIKAAELRSVAKEYNALQTSTNLFKNKYFAIPGDMVNATQFWGRADNGTFSGQCANKDDDQGTGTQTCNGDGNGRVTTDNATATFNEAFRFWEHLGNAGLIEGQFTGIHGSGGTFQSIARENVPASKYGQGAWNVMNLANSAGDSIRRYAMDYGNYFLLQSSINNSVNAGASAAIFPPEDAWNIDVKMDDGMPGRGKVIGFPHSTCTLAANQTDYDAGYALNTSDLDCSLIFRQAL